MFQKPQIAARDDAYQAAILGDWHTGDVRLLHGLVCAGNASIRWQCDRVDDDSIGRSLDLVDLIRLCLDRHVFVNHPQSTLQSQGNGHLTFGDGVHR